MTQTLSIIQVIINAFNADTEPDQWRAHVECDDYIADQDALAISAVILGLAPLLDWQLSVWGLTLAPRAMAKLAAAHETARQQQHALDTQLTTILSALNTRAIEPIVLKGNYLAARVYPEPGLRQMNDIDLLVRRDELTRAEAALLELGYVASRKSAERGAGVVKHTSTFRPPRADDPTPNPYLSAVAGRTVEPHTSLEESWYGLRADITPGVWERSIPLDVNGSRARALASDDLILHLSVHLTFHLIMGYPSLVQLVDILFVTRPLREQIHWEAVVSRAVKQRAAPFVYAALRLARNVLAAPIPSEVIDELARACPARVRAHADKLSLANLMARTQRPPVLSIAQRVRRGWEERAEVARWAITPADQWRVWRTLLDIAHTDTGELVAQRLRGARAKAAA